VTPPSPYFPDSFIWLLPVFARIIQQTINVAPKLVGNRSAILIVEVDRIEKFPIDVELKLFISRVSDSDGPGSPITLQMVKGFLG
jgi:hypothetical protein